MNFFESVDIISKWLGNITQMMDLYIKEQWAAIIDRRVNGSTIDINEEIELRWIVKLMNELNRIQYENKKK